LISTYVTEYVPVCAIKIVCSNILAAIAYKSSLIEYNRAILLRNSHPTFMAQTSA